MTGLIWFVQVVHYPLFDQADRSQFRTFHADHSRLTTYVVIVPMLLELVSSVGLLVARPEGSSRPLIWIGAALAAITWASTAFLQVPTHEKLSGGFERKQHRFLVRSNWIRTFAWSAHSVVCLRMTADLITSFEK